MPVRLLTTEQHQDVLRRLIDLARSINGTNAHREGWEFTSLMVCFLMHQVGAAEALLKLAKQMTNDWFPATAGYVIVRSLFETDVTAHYLAAQPKDRVPRYIEFEHITKKQRMDACAKHRQSANQSWREGMDLEWRHHWASIEVEVNADYQRVLPLFQPTNGNGRGGAVRNWSGKSIRQMAIEVDHEAAYDIFYADLSSFTHVDVNLANRFLRLKDGDVKWSQKPHEFDVGNVFRYAATFLTCFLELYGKEFRVWDSAKVRGCWEGEA
jgi:hypothetical protein